jgi:hypothetical protein
MKLRDERIINELDRLLVVALKELNVRKSIAAVIIGRSENTVCRWYRIDDACDTFFSDEFVEQVKNAAVRMYRSFKGKRTDSHKQTHSELLVVAREIVEKIKEPEPDPEQERFIRERIYASGVVDLWSRLNMRRPAAIFRYEAQVRGSYSQYMGSFFRIPSQLLPFGWEIQGNDSTPVLALTYDDGHENENGSKKPHEKGMIFCNAHGNCTNPVLFVCHSSSGKIPVKIEGNNVEGNEVHDFCAGFFRKKGYDPSKDLMSQVNNVWLKGESASDNFRITRYEPYLHRSIEHRVDKAAGSSLPQGIDF